MSNGTSHDVNLPSHWDVARIGDVARVNPRMEKNGVPDELVVSFVPMKAVEEETGRMDVSCARPLAEVRKGYTPFCAGDVIMAKITPCMENGKIAVVPEVAGGLGFGSTEFHVLRPHDGVSPYWLFFYLLQRSYRRDARLRMTGSAGQLRVPAEFLANSELPVAPSAEQRRIVAEIEKQFSRLDAGVAALRRVEANLKRYKAAVLKAACTGTLTADWRAANPDVEPASKLLDRILRERRRRWEEAELAKMTAKGKPPRDDKWKAKYKEPAAPLLDDLPELPAAWLWVTADQLCHQITDGEHIQPPYQPSGHPMLSAKHVRDGFVVLDDAGLISSEAFDQASKRCAPQKGDLLVVSVGATTGRAAIVGDLEPFVIVRSVLLLKPLIAPLFLLRWIQSPWCQQWVVRASGASAQAHFYITDAKRMPVPLPTETEIDGIVADTECRISIVDALRMNVADSRARASRLRQSILRDAFEGKLVEQDPTDEPASALLARIQGEREKLAANGKPRRTVRRRRTRKGASHA